MVENDGGGGWIEGNLGSYLIEPQMCPIDQSTCFFSACHRLKSCDRQIQRVHDLAADIRAKGMSAPDRQPGMFFRLRSAVRLFVLKILR